MLNNFPIVSYGASTGFAPIHVKIMNELKNIQMFILYSGFIFAVFLYFFMIGKIMIIKMDISRATTPPSLFGIDRRMAYANRKYHSG